MCMPTLVARIDPPLLRTVALAEAAAGVAPLRPTPAGYQSRGYGCAMKPPPRAKGWNPRSLCTTERRLGGRGEGRGEGYGEVGGRATWWPHIWGKARGARLAPCGATATPQRPRRPRAPPECGRRPRRGGYRCCGGVWGNPRARITAYHTANTRGMEASIGPAAASESRGGREAYRLGGGT